MVKDYAADLKIMSTELQKWSRHKGRRLNYKQKKSQQTYHRKPITPSANTKRLPASYTCHQRKTVNILHL